jgi:hypothetical protein
LDRRGPASILLALLPLVGVSGCAGEPAADPATVELAPEKQRFIWDLEHVTFKLETYLGKPLLAVNAAEFADHLLESVAALTTIDRPDETEALWTVRLLLTADGSGQHGGPEGRNDLELTQRILSVTQR